MFSHCLVYIHRAKMIHLQCMILKSIRGKDINIDFDYCMTGLRGLCMLRKKESCLYELGSSRGYKTHNLVM